MIQSLSEAHHLAIKPITHEKVLGRSFISKPNSTRQASIAASEQSHDELFTRLSKRMRSCHLHQMNRTGKFNIKENKMGPNSKAE